MSAARTSRSGCSREPGRSSSRAPRRPTAAAARRWPGARPGSHDVVEHDTRLYALPVSQAGRRLGAVVAGGLAGSLRADAAHGARRLGHPRAGGPGRGRHRPPAG